MICWTKQRNSMTDSAPIPDDDLTRQLGFADPDGPGLTHLGIAGGTYTILLGGKDTNGRYTLIDMLVPANGGPPPHRHDFEEMFTVLEGEIVLTFRGAEFTAKAGQTVNIPANAPHSFKNASGAPARLLCMCTPAGQEDYFTLIGDRVASRTATGPELNESQRAERGTRNAALAKGYKTEMLPR
jgi:quercetin dioxygenase-like cupin family protein